MTTLLVMVLLFLQALAIQRENSDTKYKLDRLELMYRYRFLFLFSLSRDGNNLFYGDLHAYGKQAVRFYTETKTVTERWFDDEESSETNLTIDLK